MAEPDQSDIPVDEIMRRIKEEVQRRKGSSSASPAPPVQSPLPVDSNGREKNISPQPEIISLESLNTYIQSIWFMGTWAKGFKTRIKRFIFKGIRFYAWWQEHINRAFYEELIRQQSKIREMERGVQETFQQKFGEWQQELRQVILLEKQETVERENTIQNRMEERAKGLQTDLAGQAKNLSEIGDQVVHLRQAAATFQNKVTLEMGEEKTRADQTLEGIRQQIQTIAGQIRGHRLNITDQERKLAILLEEARKRFPAKWDQEQMQKMLQEKDHLLDAFYVTFEDRFRGTRKDIKERLKAYLPYIRRGNTGTEEYPILDLGCGRGEWLELLKEEGILAKGIDCNRIMVSTCKEHSLEAQEGDALESLRQLKANSLGAVTGFQFVEHISLNTLVDILDECLRVLRSGGLIIFETPNPENLVVGAYSFYIDPTHKTPLVPDSLNFIAQERGFVETRILRLHKYSDFHPVDRNPSDFQNQWFYSETDFALIGYKP